LQPRFNQTSQFLSIQENLTFVFILLIYGVCLCFRLPAHFGLWIYVIVIWDLWLIFLTLVVVLVIQMFLFALFFFTFFFLWRLLSILFILPILSRYSRRILLIRHFIIWLIRITKLHRNLITIWSINASITFLVIVDRFSTLTLSILWFSVNQLLVI
jgi:hypothetical protein